MLVMIILGREDTIIGGIIRKIRNITAQNSSLEAG